ncbi:MAG TPA: hypothetical protein ENN61_04435, partial [Bacteroidaceae bacterium]|nr:hypothetical protein [Bacteroidaceae bacterium]
MKHLTLPLILLIQLLILVNGCQDQREYVNLYSGTSPKLEIPDNEESVIEPASLFIRIMDDKLEYLGDTYDYEIVDENNHTITMETSLVINRELEVGSIIYNKQDKTLSLVLSKPEATIKLETYDSMIDRKVQEFIEVDLTADISRLSDNQKEMLKILFEVADIMEEIYWLQVFPDKDAVIESIMDENLKRFFRINYGPWERLNGDLPFMQGYGQKSPGSGFYPEDMTIEEFNSLEDWKKSSLY